MHVGQQPVSLPTRARGKLTGALAGRSGPLPLPLALTWQTGFSQQLNSSTLTLLDTLGIEPRASRMLSGCDTTTPRAPYNSWVGCTITKCHTRFIWLRARLTSGRGGVPTHVVSGLRREAAAPGADACNRDGGTGQACSNSAS